MNQDAYCTATDELFQDPILKNMRQEMLVFLEGALKTQQQVQLSGIFIFILLVSWWAKRQREISSAWSKTHCKMDSKSHLDTENLSFQESVQVDCS